MNSCLSKAQAFAVLFASCIFFSRQLKAQDSLTMALGRIAVVHEGPGLRLGESIPPVVLKTINYVDPPRQFSDLKGKWVILDFWHQYCSSCLTQFPRLEALQQKYSDKLLVLPVTFQSRVSVARFLEKRREAGKDLHLPSIVEDTLLRKYFPHHGDPYEVWINPDGKLIGLTNQFGVQDTIIEAVLQGNEKALQAVSFSDEAAEDAFSIAGADSAKNDGLVSYVQLTRYNPHIRPLEEFKQEAGKKRFVFANRTVVGLLKSLIRPEESSELYTLFRFSQDNLNKRVLRKGPKALALKDFPDINPGNFKEMNEFIKTNIYCANMVLPQLTDYQGANALLRDYLQTMFGVKLGIRKQRLPCLALVKLKNTKDRKQAAITLPFPAGEEGIAVFDKQPVTTLVNAMNAVLKIPYVVDRTNYKKAVSMKLRITAGLQLQDLRKELNSYGFDLKNVFALMDMLLIEDK